MQSERTTFRVRQRPTNPVSKPTFLVLLYSEPTTGHAKRIDACEDLLA